MKGIYYWLSTCIFSSFMQSFLFIKWINLTGAFHFKFIDFLAIGLVLSLLSLLASTPLIFCYRQLSKIKLSFFKAILFYNLLLILFIILVYCGYFLYNKKMSEANQLIIPYASIGFALLNTYLIANEGVS